ncbi:MAG: hypothetical protein KAR22_22610, partial [Gammaproteobacteria bacterium]|nr:hypothetical protein [Gammaproteobacteria bacterium]
SLHSKIVDAMSIRMVRVSIQPSGQFLVTRPVLGGVEITLRQNMTEKDIILKLSDKFIRLYPGAVGLHGKDRSVALYVSS